MTLPELNAEVNRISDHLSTLPAAERRKSFDEQINLLPDIAKELVRSIVSKTVELSQFSGGRLIILVHGIRTRAEWQGRLRHLFEKDGLTVVEPLGYGFFDVIRFLFPFWTRRKPVNEVLFRLRDAMNQHRHENREVIFLAHSFGSYILGTILEKNPDIQPDRMLLCGSVLSRKYRWDKLPIRPIVQEHLATKSGVHVFRIRI